MADSQHSQSLQSLLLSRIYCHPVRHILIDPDLESEDYGRDLFPGSFIYTLSDSSDYFGAEKVFGDFDEPRPRHLRFIDDIDDFLPRSTRARTRCTLFLTA